jgi:hypothetical protein
MAAAYSRQGALHTRSIPFISVAAIRAPGSEGDALARGESGGPARKAGDDAVVEGREFRYPKVIWYLGPVDACAALEFGEGE